ncbi:MAG TPA: penicillin-binding protein 2 [Chloroflexi bacterium]|nr:penicillin-binding protein 2 [Chloroflexota bacterium]
MSTAQRPLNGFSLQTADSGPRRPSWIQRAPRLAVMGWVIILVLGIYLIRLWQLQFLERRYYEALAEQQQYRLDTVSPPRGIIYARNGETLVRNIPAYNITITPGYLPAERERERAVLERLSLLIDVPYERLFEEIDAVRYHRPYAPRVVLRNADREIALLVAQEGGITMPGVDVEIVTRRSYAYGALTSQAVGFLGPIPPEQVAAYEASGYNPNVDRIGYAGVEASTEEYLRGEPGRRYILENVLGQELDVISERAPIAGDNIHLTLDVELQQVAETALLEQMEAVGSQRGVVIAMDPRDGQVLAMVSLPTYDNNIFARQITEEELTALYENPHQPLINHAISDQVPPGSIYKIIPATAALQEGVINRYTTVNCPGRILLPNKLFPNDPGAAQPFVCWIYLQHGGGHGPVNVIDALAQSCDIFFYQVGGGWSDTNFTGLGLERLTEYTRRFGLGERTGIDIPGEARGLVPTARWKRLNYQETWTTGDTYNLSIGQGFLLATPLQMLNSLNAIANGGTLYQPQLIHHITDANGLTVRDYTPQVIGTLDVDASVIQLVREGLYLAVADGTASRARLENVTVAGKTGTAEYCDDIAIANALCPVPEGRTLPSHAWFMAYAPYEAPEIAVIAWVYNGGEGSTVAAPIAQEVMQFYFDRQAGLLEPDELESTPATP